MPNNDLKAIAEIAANGSSETARHMVIYMIIPTDKTNTPNGMTEVLNAVLEKSGFVETVKYVVARMTNRDLAQFKAALQATVTVDTTKDGKPVKEEQPYILTLKDWVQNICAEATGINLKASETPAAQQPALKYEDHSGGKGKQ